MPHSKHDYDKERGGGKQPEPPRSHPDAQVIKPDIQQPKTKKRTQHPKGEPKITPTPIPVPSPEFTQWLQLWLPIILNAILLVLVAVQARIYYRQWKVMQEQVVEMRKSTDAATKAATAAENSVKLASENARIDQRAWVTVSAVSLSRELIPGGFPEVKIQFMNSGRTPARDVTIHGVVFVGPEPEPRLPSQEPDSIKSLVSKMVLGPGNAKESRIPGLAAIDQESIDAIRRGDTRLIVQGVISYVDIFDAPHETFFAFDYRMNVSLLLSGCKSGNDVN